MDFRREENNISECTAIIAPTEHKQIRINKWRIKEGRSVGVNQVMYLYEILSVDPNADNEQNLPKIYKYKAKSKGVVKNRLFKEGAVVEGGTKIAELVDCIHTTVIHDMCADCGADLLQNENGEQSEASVPMVHSIPDLKVTQKLAQKLGHADTRRLLKDRKLVLLVDLDQTIIHTTNDNVPANIKNIYHFQLYGPQSPWYHTRLRPRTPEFLAKISKHYELHICTFGARNYAHMIAQILDPDGQLFSQRILSRDECFNATSKTDNLKALFPNGDSLVCIIDDREDVWNMASNLIQVKPYHFFQHTGDIKAPPGLSKNELDGEGMDFKVLKNKEILPGKTALDEDQESNCSSDAKENEKSEESCDLANDQKETGITSDINDVENNLKTNEENDKVDSNNLHPENNASNVTTDEKEDLSIEDVESKLLLSPKTEEQKMEVEDSDDYLLYLEPILTSIHQRFYSIYDESKEIPDLKIIVPKIRSEVLRNCNLVFSGLVPTNMNLQQSRPYLIAKSLGANVFQSINEDTTHLVAATSGTFKVNNAKKCPRIKIVNAGWLWTCAERWEHVEEQLFPLDRNIKSKRQPPAHCHSPEHVINYSEKSEISPNSSAQLNASLPQEKFIDTLNPLLSFSNADLDDMNKEFEQFFDSSSSSDDEHPPIENSPVNRNARKRKQEEQGDDRIRKFFNRSVHTKLDNSLKSLGNNDEDDDVEKMCTDENLKADEDKMSNEKLNEDLDIDSESDASGSVCASTDEQSNADWNMMGAALEREFLGLD